MCKDWIKYVVVTNKCTTDFVLLFNNNKQVWTFQKFPLHQMYSSCEAISNLSTVVANCWKEIGNKLHLSLSFSFSLFLSLSPYLPHIPNSGWGSLHDSIALTVCSFSSTVSCLWLLCSSPLVLSWCNQASSFSSSLNLLNVIAPPPPPPCRRSSSILSTYPAHFIRLFSNLPILHAQFHFQIIHFLFISLLPVIFNLMQYY